MSEFDLAPLRQTLSKYTPQGRTALLPVLHAAQRMFGYIPEPAAIEIGKALRLPLADISGVIDFYSMFYREPIGEKIVRVCTSPACAHAGSDGLLSALLKDQNEHTGKITMEGVPCLGLCAQAPAVLIDDEAVGSARSGYFQDLFEQNYSRKRDTVGGDIRLLTSHCGKDTPASITDYHKGGGYEAFKKALQMSPNEILDEVSASGLVGRGGAAFPTGVKWAGCTNTIGEPKYVICNADESEPGTFKDRILLEGDPHRMLEGLLIAAYAVGASKGYVYVRGEYHCAFTVLVTALQEARDAGYLGTNLLGTAFGFDIELRLGAGAYICGEETAMFESIEGKRGFPRLKPPFPTTHGLFGQPTVINNVETLCNVPFIIQSGAAAYRKIGTQKSPGPKLFCLSGDVSDPGLYEVPFGTSMRHLVYDLAGGIPEGREFQSALIGGAAGTFATQEHLDLPMTFEDFSAVGMPLGSGVVMVFDERRDLRDVLLRLSEFFAHESCGKCYPCQIGTQRQYEIMQRVAAGKALPGDPERLADVGWTMSDASICGLGQTAATAVLNAIEHWPEMFEV